MQHRASTSAGFKASTPRGANADRDTMSAVSMSPAPTAGRSRNDLSRAVDTWLRDGRSSGWSPRTLKDREQNLRRFTWWVKTVAGEPPILEALDPNLIRDFIAYLREPQPGGRWGGVHHATSREPRPSTVNTYYRTLRAFTNFCREEGCLSDSPLRNVKVPRVPQDQIQPFRSEDIQALLDAALCGHNPARDTSLILVLLDTGLRAAELCSLSIADIDRGAGCISVLGKGGKRRAVYMGTKARRSLWRYLEHERRGADASEPLFVSTGGRARGTGLTPSGLHSIIQELGRNGRLTGVRCSPHTLRHTFAVNFLRNGGNLFELQQLMGHSDLTVLRRYVALAEADLAQAHRSASPVDRMKLR